MRFKTKEGIGSKVVPNLWYSMLTLRFSSLSLQSNASQERILHELEQLKYSFKEALRVSSQSDEGMLRGRTEHPDSRVSRNLHNLAAAARHFHSAASSTSGTTRTGSSAPSQYIPPLSLIGDFPDHKRQQVEAFVQAGRYPSPESVPTSKQSSLRTNSPAPSQDSVFQDSREMSASGSDNALPSQPTLQVSEFDEDEEFEEEWEYFDGLRDLARDRITKQDYTKAIEFINQAMTKVGNWDCMDEVSMQLKYQLALCHFFKGDWRSAEPIVVGLATLALNEVTCNLLHALSLAHLFEYSLDSALKFCRKALKGKRSILEKDQMLIGGPLEADYGNMLALCSTIYHMKGDPIRAEVYHRRLPKSFEYTHPSSDLEFIFNHPRLLPAVLGDDIPRFDTGRPENHCISPGSSFVFGWETVPEGAQNLYTSGTVANSPLRQRFARHELYENDTDKIVVDGPSLCSPRLPASPTDSAIDMTADEENISVKTSFDDTSDCNMPSKTSDLAQRNDSTGLQSTSTSTTANISGPSTCSETVIGEAMVDDALPSEPPWEFNKSPEESSPIKLQLRRRVTRMFNVRRLRPTAANEHLIAPLTCPPEPSASSSAWMHRSSRPGIPRSKSMLRNSSFHEEYQNGYTARSTGGQRTLRLGRVELTFKRTARFSGLENMQICPGSLPAVDGETCSGQHLEHRYNSGSSASDPPSRQSRGRLSGLTTKYYGPDPSVGPYTCDDEQWPDLGYALATAGNVSMPHGPGDIVAAIEIGSSESAIGQHLDKVVPNYGQNIAAWPTSRGVDQGSTTPGPCFGNPFCAMGDDAHPNVDPTSSRVRLRQRLRLDTNVKAGRQPHNPAQCRAQLPGRLACVLASLPVATEIDKQAVITELQTLVSHVRNCLNDSILEADLQRAIVSLSIRGSPGTNNDHEYVLSTEMDGEATSSVDSVGEWFLPRSPPVRTVSPRIGTQQHPDPAAGLGDDSTQSLSGTAPGYSLATKPGKRELRVEDKLSFPELHRAFSFMAGDDARFMNGSNTQNTRSCSRILEEDELDTKSSTGDVVQRKQVSWAAVDSVEPGTLEKDMVLSSKDNEDGRKDQEISPQEENMAEVQHKSARKPRFSIRDVSQWKRARPKAICSSVG